MYIKEINRHLQKFVNVWDNHKLTSRKCSTPNQLWEQDLDEVLWNNSTEKPRNEVMWSSALIPYSDKIWLRFNMAQGKKEIFEADLIQRS